MGATRPVGAATWGAAHPIASLARLWVRERHARNVSAPVGPVLSFFLEKRELGRKKVVMVKEGPGTQVRVGEELFT